MPISALDTEFLMHFIPYYLLNFWVFEEVGRGYGRTLYIEQYNMGRFAAFAWATLGLFRRHLPFVVTSKEQSPSQQAIRFLLPQIVILTVNAVAIPAGIGFYLYLRHLPLGGVVANVIWAWINLSLALAIVYFTLRRSSFLRKEYRFPISLPAKVRIGSNPAQYLTVDNISPSGCKLYGAFPTPPRPGEAVSGVIFLPAGPLPFRGHIAALLEVQSGEARYTKAIGCRFEWQEAKEKDYLKLFSVRLGLAVATACAHGARQHAD